MEMLQGTTAPGRTCPSRQERARICPHMHACRGCRLLSVTSMIFCQHQLDSVLAHTSIWLFLYSSSPRNVHYSACIGDFGYYGARLNLPTSKRQSSETSPKRVGFLYEALRRVVIAAGATRTMMSAHPPVLPFTAESRPPTDERSQASQPPSMMSAHVCNVTKLVRSSQRRDTLAV